MAASRETLARTIEPSTLKRKFEELEEVLEGVSIPAIDGRNVCERSVALVDPLLCLKSTLSV
jgi:hypothetical protein